MLGRQTSDGQLYMKRKDGGRRLKSLREAYEKQGYMYGVIRVCQIIGGSRKLENKKQEKRVTLFKDKVILIMQTKGKIVQFEREDMKIDGKTLEKEFKPT